MESLMSCTRCGARMPSGNLELHMLRCRGTVPAVPASSSWACGRCTFQNEGHMSDRCQMCNAVRSNDNRPAVQSPSSGPSEPAQQLEPTLQQLFGLRGEGPLEARRIRQGLESVQHRRAAIRWDEPPSQIADRMLRWPMVRGEPPFGAFAFGGEDELLRRVMAQSFEDDVPQVERASNRDIARLPVQCLTADDVASATDDHKSCTICMEDFKAGDEQKTLPCFHKYHAQCVDQWLQRSGCCPVCKHRVEDES